MSIFHNKGDSTIIKQSPQEALWSTDILKLLNYFTDSKWFLPYETNNGNCLKHGAFKFYTHHDNFNRA